MRQETVFENRVFGKRLKQLRKKVLRGSGSLTRKACFGKKRNFFTGKKRIKKLRASLLNRPEIQGSGKG
jgi:hypothetical protein